jgi:multiple sugar transport system substrate-binding protein
MIVVLALFASLALTACAAPAAPAAETGGGETATEGGGKILFWSTESQPERVTKTQEILKKFTEQSGIEVELVPVDEGQLSQQHHSGEAQGLQEDSEEEEDGISPFTLPDFSKPEDEEQDEQDDEEPEEEEGGRMIDLPFRLFED